MNKKQLIINTTANVLSFVFSFGISFFLSPYIVQNIGKEANGFVSLGNQFVSYATILTSALNSMLSRFVSIEIYRDNKEERDKYFSSAVLTNIIISLVLLVPICFLIVFLEKVIFIPGELVFDVKLLWIFIFANFLIGLLTNSYGIAVFAKNKLYLNSLRTIEKKVINIGILILLFAFLKPAVWYVGFASIFCAIYSLIYNIYYTRKFYPDLKCNVNNFSLKHLKQLLSAGMWNSIGQLSRVLNEGFDLLICNLFISASAMGTMSIAKIIPANVVAIAPLFGDMFLPEITKNFALDDKEVLFENIDFSRKIMAFVGAIIVGVAIVNSGAFFQLWMPNQDAQLLQLIAIVSLMSYVFITSLAPVTNVITVANKQKVAVISYFICGILNLIIVFCLLKFVDIGIINPTFINKQTLQLLIVAGTSSVITILRDTTIVTIYAAKCLGYKWYCFYPTLFKALLANVIVIAIAIGCNFIVPINSWITFIVSSGMSVILGGLLIAVVLFDINQIKLILKTASKKILRKN